MVQERGEAPGPLFVLLHGTRGTRDLSIWIGPVCVALATFPGAGLRGAQADDFAWSA